MKNGYLPARVIQLTGLLLLIAAFVVWVYTGRESFTLISAAMSLIFAGSYKNLADSLTKSRNGTPPKEKG